MIYSNGGVNIMCAYCQYMDWSFKSAPRFVAYASDTCLMQDTLMQVRINLTMNKIRNRKKWGQREELMVNEINFYSYNRGLILQWIGPIFIEQLVSIKRSLWPYQIIKLI